MADITPSKISNQQVAVLAISLACAMVFGSFFMSKADHDLKLMSLQAVLTLGGTLVGIAGTLLVGVQAYRSLSGGDISGGGTSKTTQTTETSVPVVYTPPEIVTPAPPIHVPVIAEPTIP